MVLQLIASIASYGELLPWREVLLTGVTNPLGRREDHVFFRRDSDGFVPRVLISITGLATENVPADSRSWAYSGLDIIGTIDSNGNQTNFLLDAPNHRFTSTTEAVSTAVARTTATDWQTNRDLPTREERPGLRVTYTYTPAGQMLTRTETDTTTQTVPYSTGGQVRT